MVDVEGMIRPLVGGYVAIKLIEKGEKIMKKKKTRKIKKVKPIKSFKKIKY